MTGPATERTMRAKIAAATRWANEPDRSKATQAARSGLRAKFARQVDPDGTMPADEVEYRVEKLIEAHMLRMSLAAARARRLKAEGAK